jgi:ribosomal protein S27E
VPMSVRVETARCAEIGVPAQTFIRVMCPNLGCQRILTVPVTARGKVVRCGACGQNVRIPMPKPTTEGSPRDGDKGQAA